MNAIFHGAHSVLLPSTVVIRNICKYLSVTLVISFKSKSIVCFRFDIRQENFFTPAVRSRIVQFILDRQRFTPKTKNDMAFGIERLIAENAYCAAYPLHDVSTSTKNVCISKLSSFP